MTAPGARQEIDDVSAAYQAALTQIGVQTAAEALALWDDVPPGRRAAQSSSWLAAAVKLIMRRRTQSITLARSYYRLTRALATGATTPDPAQPKVESTTLDELRTAFVEQLPAQTRYHPETGGSGEAGGHSEAIPVEAIAAFDERAIERAAEQEIRTVLVALGPVNQDKLVAAIKPLNEHGLTKTIKEVDAARSDAHKQAGARQAAAATRIAMNGARSTVWAQQESDKRAIGWARVSTTGTPCGWCAMLISRGAVYRSEKSAAFDYEDGDKYHDNCHCIAVPVFSQSQFDASPRFAQNREFGRLWPQVTQGLGGESAVSAWRRFIRQQQRDAKGNAA